MNIAIKRAVGAVLTAGAAFASVGAHALGYGFAGDAGHGGTQVGPDERPATQATDDIAETFADILVHRARPREARGELVEVECHEQQHHRAQRIGEPAPGAGGAIHQRHDQRRRHGR